MLTSVFLLKKGTLFFFNLKGLCKNENSYFLVARPRKLNATNHRVLLSKKKHWSRELYAAHRDNCPVYLSLVSLSLSFPLALSASFFASCS